MTDITDINKMLDTLSNDYKNLTNLYIKSGLVTESDLKQILYLFTTYFDVCEPFNKFSLLTLLFIITNIDDTDFSFFKNIYMNMNTEYKSKCKEGIKNLLKNLLLLKKEYGILLDTHLPYIRDLVRLEVIDDMTPIIEEEVLKKILSKPSFKSYQTVSEGLIKKKIKKTDLQLLPSETSRPKSRSMYSFFDFFKRHSGEENDGKKSKKSKKSMTKSNSKKKSKSKDTKKKKRSYRKLRKH